MPLMRRALPAAVPRKLKARPEAESMRQSAPRRQARRLCAKWRESTCEAEHLTVVIIIMYIIKSCEQSRAKQ